MTLATGCGFAPFLPHDRKTLENRTCLSCGSQIRLIKQRLPTSGPGKNFKGSTAIFFYISIILKYRNINYINFLSII